MASYQNYHSTKLKNMELIKKYGPSIYKEGAIFNYLPIYTYSAKRDRSRVSDIRDGRYEIIKERKGEKRYFSDAVYI